MATKTGRNDPCPCGSGKKFKQCCLRKEEEAEREAMAALTEARKKGSGGSYSDLEETLDRLEAEYEEDVALADASNAAMKLVRAGKLDEAEQAARDLLVRFPEVHDGYDRLGMVYEARGDNKQAAQYYRQALNFIRQRPDQYNDSGLEVVFQKLVAKLDPPAP
jgi:tetratricopeptide (TPR) repeat protein